ncbi:hypothetical protein [Clostridium neonatale]|uniref:hypothetical protein n=1 Tax=Clostridium neonatale TaxID=137838 RepID=UPI00291B825C|nr:hypothetical protein [Clostridium neonatale]CAI3202430.1 hypothetical protein CNEO2_350017 [Clostridium neonatale]CAI3211219.1 hypothetical protein CNEO2_480017 [Clostridium neonatale]
MIEIIRKILIDSNLYKAEEYRKKFFLTDRLYAHRSEKYLAKRNHNYYLDQFIEDTKLFIVKGIYDLAKKNIKILYYLDMLNNIEFKDYNNIQIEKDRIDIEYLENQKYMIEEYLGKYQGMKSNNQRNLADQTATAVFGGIICGLILLMYQNVGSINTNLYIIIAITTLLIFLGVIFMIMDCYKSYKRKECFYVYKNRYFVSESSFSKA